MRHYTLLMMIYRRCFKQQANEISTGQDIITVFIINDPHKILFSKKKRVLNGKYLEKKKDLTSGS